MTDNEKDYAGKLRFKKDEVDLDKVREAESLLREAGVTFDTGQAIAGDASVRVWQLDWSLDGAELHIKPNLDSPDVEVDNNNE